MKKLIEKSDISEVVCDNENCDFIFKLKSLTNLSLFVDMPCPKCGEPLLTQEDYDHAIAFNTAVSFINKWFGWLAYIIPKKTGRKEVFKVHTHKGINITKVEPK